MYPQSKLHHRENSVSAQQSHNDDPRATAAALVWRSLLAGLLGLLLFALASPAQASTEIAFYEFTFSSGDATNPNAGLVRDKKGNLYGMAPLNGGFGLGAIYKVFPFGGEVLLYSFTGGSDGIDPQGKLTIDKAGNLYGAACGGGDSNLGTVFKLSTTGVFTTLHSFSGTDGSCPTGGMVLDKAGNLYGTSFRGGSTNSGTVFRVTTSGTFKSLYSFVGGTDGANPLGGIAIDAKGNLYGTTGSGGSFNFGTVYELSAGGVHTLIWNFSGGPDGKSPNAGVAFKKGSVYGTTLTGGSFGAGIVFVARPHTLSELYSFTGSTDGSNPNYGVIFDKQGNLYGTTALGGKNFLGTVFEVKMGPPITETVLYSFTGGPDDGLFPEAGLVMDQAGGLYGTTSDGGDQDCVNGCGIVFKVVP